MDKTGPEQSKTGLIVKSKTLRKKHLCCKVFGFEVFPRDSKATTVLRQVKRRRDRPRTVLKQLHHSPRQDQAAQDRPSTAQHRTKTSQDRLTFEAKNIERPLVYERFSGFQATANANPRPRQPPDMSRQEETTPDSLQTAHDLPLKASDRPKTG